MLTDAELEAFLDEALPADVMSRLEQSLREDKSLLDRLAAVSSDRDSGVHSLAAIWRTNRITCPSRQELGNYLLGVLTDEQSDFIKFHVDKSGCRVCQANLNDLQAQQSEAATIKESRRRKYFQSSAGSLAGVKRSK
jgi:hypothetical protein